MRILITGGLGFIGSRLGKLLAGQDCDVILLDSISPQIHKDISKFSNIQSRRIKVVVGDVRDRETVSDCLRDADVIYHLAAETGTGQSLYKSEKYTSVNCVGTALLLDLLAANPKQVKKVIVASSRAIYGEGAYHCPKDGLVYPESRDPEKMAARDFQVYCPECNSPVEPSPTPENAPIKPVSLYGVTKAFQELAILSSCKAYDVPAVALRFQNVFGPGQSLSNPYTGVLSVWSTRLRNGKTLEVYEDGKEGRDFVFVDDVVDALVLALKSSKGDGKGINIGSGQLTSLLGMSTDLSKAMKSGASVEVSGRFRKGDIRHNFADLKRAADLLGYMPKTSVKEGIERFADWVLNEPVAVDRYDQTLQELKERKLT
jgi:dTDP-L-rhamnose 4-epimerase